MVTFWNNENIGDGSIALGVNTLASGHSSVSIGLRNKATNTGSVALGHLTICEGNSAFAAGYQTRADAMVSAALGAGNIGGGNRHLWIEEDPIFEIGNSVDPFTRSNALTVLKNAKTGINTATPASMLEIFQPGLAQGNGISLDHNSYNKWETSIDVTGDYGFYNDNIARSYIKASDGAYIAYSDRRLKKNIESIGDVLNKVMLIKTKTYAYKGAKNEDDKSFGVIAQELQKVFPDLVEEKDYLGVNYQGLNIITLKAVQELTRENVALKSELEIIKERMKKLEEKQDELLKKLGL